MENSKKIAAVLAGIIVVSTGIFFISKISAPAPTSDEPMTKDKAYSILTTSAEKTVITENLAEKGTVSFDEVYGVNELPDIDKSFPYTVTPSNKELTVEIFCSPEKAGTGTDGWMRELAETFNNSDITINEKSAGIALRSMSSGPQVDYIKAGVYMPDAISPSASMWGEMIKSAGVKVDVISEQTVSNTAGIIIDNTTYNTLESSYGQVDIKTIVDATAAGQIATGYTNPFSSTTGLNFLASTLYCYDASNPLSESAIDGFNSFQKNVPFVAYNTLQMRTAANNNTFSCFILEHQLYNNDINLKANYKFIPYGMKHDNPLYAIGNISIEKRELLEKFAEYCKTPEALKLASEYGFNLLNDYDSTLPEINGNTWTQMQKLWKTNKNTSRPIAAIFVLDTSGSMQGEPISALKTSMVNSIKYINSSNYIGVIDYSTNVNVALPIGLFDINQQAYFQGAVSGLVASGQTSTYSALSKAAIMLEDFVKDNPNVQPMIFLLSDGQSNSGAKFNDINEALLTLGIPVYTIGYNANLDELKKISEINEAASINADNDDVVYQLKNLFNANL